eukprot:Ihof_evm14s34 gene=Ihof_evmTU14s34
MSFSEYHDNVQWGDIVIFYLGIDNMVPVTMTPKAIFSCRTGEYRHDEIVGKRFGTKVYNAKNNGFATILYPTPELWTACLPHRTQIIYTPDISMITMYLDLKPGSVVVEAGTGSGSLSHGLARTIGPTGTLYTMDFHEVRAATAKKEFEAHGLGSVVVSSHRDVLGQGFGLKGVADAVFLDLPAPWDALDSAMDALKPTGGRICSFSPCLEQVQKTCEKLRKLGFTDVYTCESLMKTFSVKQQQIPILDFATPETPSAGEEPQEARPTKHIKLDTAEGDVKGKEEIASTEVEVPKDTARGPPK